MYIKAFLGELLAGIRGLRKYLGNGLMESKKKEAYSLLRWKSQSRPITSQSDPEELTLPRDGTGLVLTSSV